MHNKVLFAILVVMILLVIGAACYSARAHKGEGYLIAPYLDLDEPGERGSYYGLIGC